MRIAKGFLLLCPLFSVAWGATLSLNAGSTSGSTLSIPLLLASSGSQIAAVQWSLSYSNPDTSSINISAGVSVSTAAKQLTCNSPKAGQYVCVVWGLSDNVIPDGVIATAAVTLSSSSTTSLVVNGMSASDPNGAATPISTTGSAITITQPSNTLSGLTCAPSSITVPGSSSCVVTLAAAPTVGVAVSLGYTGSRVTMSLPNSVTVPAGSTQASFSAQAVSAPFSTAVTVTAALNGVSQSYSLAVAPASTTLPPSAPTAPANLTGVAMSSSQINLSWTASNDSLGISAYLVESCRGAGCTYFVQIATTTTTTYADTRLSARTMYSSYRVRARDIVGNLSPYSNVVVVKTTTGATQHAPI